jgi:hypothetical protein
MNDGFSSQSTVIFYHTDLSLDYKRKRKPKRKKEGKVT